MAPLKKSLGTPVLVYVSMPEYIQISTSWKSRDFVYDWPVFACFGYICWFCFPFMLCSYFVKKSPYHITFCTFPSQSTHFYTFSTIFDRKGGMQLCLGCCCWDFLWQDLYTYVQYTPQHQTPTWMLPIELKGNVIN